MIHGTTNIKKVGVAVIQQWEFSFQLSAPKRLDTTQSNDLVL